MNGYRNFHRVTKKAPGNCRLKDHFFGGHREVIGYLDMLASRDKERFVFPHVPTIVAHCKKYQTKELHGQSWVEKILRDLRRWHIISTRVTRVRNYKELRGVIVAPHAALTERKPAATATGKGTVCVYVGQRWSVGRWERKEIKTTTPDGRKVWTIVPVSWAGGNAVSGAAEAAVSSAVDGAAHSAVSSAVESAVCLSPYSSDSEKVNPEKSARTESSLRALQTEGAVQTPASLPEPTQPKEKSAGQAGGVPSSSSSSSRMTSKAKSENEIRWSRFIEKYGNQLPDEMRFAKPTPEERDAVIKQIDDLFKLLLTNKDIKNPGDFAIELFAESLIRFVENRTPPIKDREYHRWQVWLDEGELNA
jgi:hypothetical protein